MSDRKPELFNDVNIINTDRSGAHGVEKILLLSELGSHIGHRKIFL